LEVVVETVAVDIVEIDQRFAVTCNIEGNSTDVALAEHIAAAAGLEQGW
jgi:hypothetical protein